MPTTPTPTRTLTIVYGSVTMGGSTVYAIDATPGRMTWRVTPTEASLSWHVTVHGATSASDLETACDTLEAEFAKRFLRLRVVNDSQEVIDWDPSDSSGFLAVPGIERIDHPAQTARSRIYRCSVAVQLPADDNTGRRWASIDLAYDDGGVKTVTITGQYTAQAAVGARANYEAKISTFASAVLTALGGNYNLPTENAKADDQDKLLDFTRVYRQIIYNETAAGNIAGILSHDVRYALNWEGPGDTPGGPFGDAVRLQDVTASYVAGVDARVTTDLATLWNGTLRDYVVQQANVEYPGALALVGESVQYDKANNKIMASVRMQIASQGGLLEYDATQEVQNLPGKTIVQVWNGNRYAKRVYQGPSNTIRTTVATWRALSEAGVMGVVQGRSWAAGSAERPGGNQLNSGDEGWVLLEEVQFGNPKRVGIVRRGRTFVAWQLSARYRETWVEAVKGGPVTTPGSGPAPGGGGGGAGRATTGGGVIR